MLFSGGKDSCVMLHLARKAFFPARPPFPLLHVDTGWKFAELYALRDALAAEAGMDADRPPQSRGRGARHQSVRPWRGAAHRAVEDRGAEAGARRRPLRPRLRRRAARRGDEPGQGADLLGPLGRPWLGPEAAAARALAALQRPAARRANRCASSRSPIGPSATSGPMSPRERLAVASLYFAAERPTVERDGTLLIVDDDALPLRPASGDAPRAGADGRLLAADRRGRERGGDDRRRCSRRWRATARRSAPAG